VILIFLGINWNTLEYNTVNEEIFIKIVQDCFLTQHVQEPTRQSNILDLVLTIEPNMIDNLTVKENFSASDHQIVECELIAETVVNEVIKTRYCYDKANYDEIKQALNDIKWSERFLDKDVEEIWKIFIDIIHDIIDTHVPKKKCLRTKHQSWVNYKVKKMITCRSKKWNKFKATKTTEESTKKQEMQQQLQ